MRKIAYFFCGDASGFMIAVALFGLVGAIASHDPKATAGIFVWLIMLVIIRIVEYGREFAERERRRRCQ